METQPFNNTQRKLLMGLTLFCTIYAFSTRTVDILLVKFISAELQADVSVYTLFISLFNLAHFLALTPVSALSDKFGRRAIISIALLGYTFGTIMFYFSTTIVQLIIFRIIQGISVFLGVGIALINDHFSEGMRSKPLAFLGGSLGIGFLLGSAFGGLFLEYVGGRRGFLMVGILDLLMVPIFLFFVKEDRIDLKKLENDELKKQKKIARKVLWNNRDFQIANILQALRWLGFQAIIPYITWVIFNHYFIPDAISGLTLFPIVAAYIFGLIIAGKTTDYIGLLKRYFPILTLSGFLFVVLNFFDHIIIFLILCMIAAGCFGILMTANDAFASDTVPEEIRGESLGLYKTIGSFFGILGPLMSGFLGEYYGFLVPFYAITLLAVAGWFIAHMYFKSSMKQGDNNPI